MVRMDIRPCWISVPFQYPPGNATIYLIFYIKQTKASFFLKFPCTIPTLQAYHRLTYRCTSIHAEGHTDIRTDPNLYYSFKNKYLTFFLFNTTLFYDDIFLQPQYLVIRPDIRNPANLHI